jgi:UDP-glucose:(heptosyl)LPS alpha-1,3-glucosyltransferase
MKIALALQSFNPHGGDLEASTFALARRLLALKNDVHVVAEHFSEAGLEVPVVPHRIRATRSPLRRAAAAEAELHSIDADVVHDMGITWYADVFTSPAGSPSRTWQRQLRGAAWWARPLKRTGARLNPRTGQRAELLRRQLDGADSIRVAHSEMEADDYRSLHGLADDRIRVVYSGVDIKKFSPHTRKLRRETTRRKLGIGTKDMLLLSVADEQREGTWKFVFRALRRLVSKQVPASLVIAGVNGVSFPEKLADRFGMAKHVKVVGEVSDRIPLYAAADALLAPALYAPSDLSVLEAAACGLPCITTRENGVSELLTDGTDGYVLERHSAKDLAERMESFGDAARCERMSRAARRTAMKCTLDRNVDKIVQIYEEVVEEQGERRILALPGNAGRDSSVRRAA